MNIEDILNYKPPKQTYYDLLGCDSSSSLEQISREYKIKALQFHPDKSSDPDALETFKLIQEAKNVLMDPSSRRSYDCWLNSRIQIPFEHWRDRKGHSMHWMPAKCKNLSLKQDNSRQGSEKADDYVRLGQDSNDTSSLLNKFRNYEI